MTTETETDKSKTSDPKQSKPKKTQTADDFVLNLNRKLANLKQTGEYA